MSAINIIKAYAKKQLTKNRGSGIMELPSDMLAGTEAGKILITLQKAGMPVQQLDDFIRSEKDLVKFLNIIESTSKPRVLSGDEAAKFLNKAFPPKGKLIPFPQKRNFAEEIEAMKKSGDLVDPDNLKKSQKVTDREMFKEANERFKKKEKPKPIDPDFYDGPFDNKAEELAEIKMSNEGFIADAVARITSMEPVAALKEANKVIRREGIYKNLDETQSKKILTDSEDWIFQKDPNDLYDYNKNRPFRDDPDFDPDDPDYQDYVKNRDRDDYYTGGMVDVEPSLSDIGHGSDALMARTRLMSPGNQATTSTGLNYLLAEDNDNLRVPFSDGGMGRRAFLKLLAALGGGIAGIKSGLFGVGGKEATKKAVTETVKSAGSGTPPPYFFKLVEKIKTLGDDVTKGNATQERQQITRYKDFELTEDLGTGEKTIQRIKTDTDFQYYDETLAREDYMNYKPGAGQSDEAGRVADEYIEDTGYLRTSGPDKGELYDSADGLTEDSLKEIMEEVGEVITKKADGGRIGFRIGGSGKKFIEKIFGKGSLDVMKARDPELHKGMLEVVDMFRNRDKEGLKMYLQKFLPHMDDETIEAFIVGDAADAAGQGKYGLDNIQGQLIRLGSGRDYAGKIEMMKKADNMRKLDKLDVDKMKPNANGGLITMLGE